MRRSAATSCRSSGSAFLLASGRAGRASPESGEDQVEQEAGYGRSSFPQGLTPTYCCSPQARQANGIPQAQLSEVSELAEQAQEGRLGESQGHRQQGDSGVWADSDCAGLGH